LSRSSARSARIISRSSSVIASSLRLMRTCTAQGGGKAGDIHRTRGGGKGEDMHSTRGGGGRMRTCTALGGTAGESVHDRPGRDGDGSGGANMRRHAMRSRQGSPRGAVPVVRREAGDHAMPCSIAFHSHFHMDMQKDGTCHDTRLLIPPPPLVPKTGHAMRLASSSRLLPSPKQP
jgi:hypothetical protein